MKKLFPRFLTVCAILSVVIWYKHDANALDCPSVNLKNYQGGFVGMHVMSNTAPLQTGVRLTWRDPVDTKPASVTIFRKKIGTAFQEVGTVAGGIETYLDTQIEAKTASYFYMLRNTYFCGSVNYSTYIEVPLLLQRDNSEPRLSWLGQTQDGKYIQGKEDPLMLVVRDPDSGLNPTSIVVRHDEKSISGGKTLGSTQSSIWYTYPSKTEFSQTSTGTTLHFEAKNGVNMDLPSQDKELSLELTNNTNIVRFATPTPGGVIDPTKSFTLTWKPRSLPTSGTYTLSASTDLGKNWTQLQASAATSFPVSLSTLFPELLDKRKEPLILFKVVLSEKNEQKAYDLLPLTVGNIHIELSKSVETIFSPAGAFKIFDAYSSKAVSFTPTNNTLVEVQKAWKFSDTQSHVDTILPPGYYYIKPTLNSYIFPTYHPEEHSGIFYFPGGSMDLTLLSDPTAYYESHREELDSNDIAIISSLQEPEIRYPYTFPTETVASNSNTNTTVEVPDDTTPPLRFDVSYCINSRLICKNDTFTALGRHSITLHYDPLQKTFFSTNASISSEEKSLIGIPTQQKNYYFNIDGIYFVQIPASIISQISNLEQSTTLFSVDKKTADGPYTFTISKQLDNAATNAKTYVFLRQQKACDREYSVLSNGVESPYFSLCGQGGDLVGILPIGTTVTLKTIQKVVTKPTSQEWFAAYMQSLEHFKLFLHPEAATHAHDYISRGELADLIVKAYHIPPSTLSPIFSDLENSHEYSSSILTLEKALVIKGELTSTGSRIVRPDSPVLRAEALKMIMVASRVQAPASTGLVPVVPFKDVLLYQWFYTYVDTAYQLHIVEGYKNADGSTELRPGSYVTRAEAAKLIITTLQKKFEE